MRVLVYKKSFESFSQRTVDTLSEQTSEDDFVMYLIELFEETTPFKAKIRHKITSLDFFCNRFIVNRFTQLKHSKR